MRRQPVWCNRRRNQRDVAIAHQRVPAKAGRNAVLPVADPDWQYCAPPALPGPAFG